MKKLAALVLVITFVLVYPGEMAANERRGIELVLKKKNGGFWAGELVAVKVQQKQFLLKVKLSEVDFVVNINDVYEIVIPRKSAALAGLLLGGLQE